MQHNFPISVGSHIRIKSYPTPTLGQVIRVNQHKVLVAVEALRFNLPLQAVEVIENSELLLSKTKKKVIQPYRSLALTPLPPMEPMESILDLHGYNCNQALVALDQFLDRSVLLGYGTLQIIHGKGRGILRKVVRNYLGQHPLVKKVIVNDPLRAMDGMTMVAL